MCAVRRNLSFIYLLPVKCSALWKPVQCVLPVWVRLIVLLVGRVVMTLLGRNILEVKKINVSLDWQLVVVVVVVC